MRIASISTLFIILYVFIGLVPYAYSIDKRYVQVLYLALVNLTALSYIFYTHRDRFLKILSKQLRILPVFIFQIFFLWSCLSIINTVNVGEFITQTNFYFQQLLAFMLLLYFLSISNNLQVLIKSLIIGSYIARNIWLAIESPCWLPVPICTHTSLSGVCMRYMALA